MNKNNLSVHGHFYQPDRIDPKSKMILWEESAAPFPNWNFRINHECYRPNADEGNFRFLSFDAGPTLLHWLETFDPATYEKIISQERENFERYGVGNGMAQPYHHTILPLAAPQDRKVQISWGIKDFEFRFGHKPAGMWLPECAVNTETLEEMARQGIQFTILAPWQSLDSVELHDIAYQIELPSGKPFSVFFYDSDLSSRVSFDPKSTENSERFLVEFGNCRSSDSEPCIRMVATDGELYGHHQIFRDKFLSHLFGAANRLPGVRVSYPGLWLQDHPASKIARLNDNTSWSCHHGLSRWSDGCGCTPNSEWKKPLRHALGSLGSEFDRHYVDAMEQAGFDGWAVLEDYVEVVNGTKTIGQILDRTNHNVRTYLGKIENLLEMQWMKHRMFTSCAWFFEDFSRIEPMIAVRCAAYGVWLLKSATSVDLRTTATELLHEVHSERTGIRGDQVFRDYFDQLDATIPIGWS